MSRPSASDTIAAVTSSPARATVDGTPWPDWLHAHSLEDAPLAGAYANTPAPYRAALKNGMALHYALWGECAGRTARYRHDTSHGFCTTRECEPAAWALCVIAADYAAPARLVAALMPALLAGVRHVGFVSVGDTAVTATPTPAMCLALDLLGLTDMFRLDGEAACALPTALPTPRLGRLICLYGAGQRAALTRLCHAAWRSGIPCVRENAPPCLRLGTAVDGDLLRWAHGPCPESPAGPDAPAADALLGAPAALGTLSGPWSAPLVLGTGMEGCWVHTRLTPDFFRNTRLHCAVISPEEDCP